MLSYLIAASLPIRCSTCGLLCLLCNFLFGISSCPSFFFFFFNDTATTEIYTLSLHDALPICYPKLEAPKGLIDVYANPPASPDECMFARTTTTISADLTTRITPCQFGGDGGGEIGRAHV